MKFKDLMEDTALGYGEWPNREKVAYFSLGRTMRQLRSYAEQSDNRSSRLTGEALTSPAYEPLDRP